MERREILEVARLARPQHGLRNVRVEVGPKREVELPVEPRCVVRASGLADHERAGERATHLGVNRSGLGRGVLREVKYKCLVLGGCEAEAQNAPTPGF